MSIKSYINMSSSLNSIEEFCKRHDILKVPILLKIQNGKKTMLNLRDYGLCDKNPKYSQWDMNQAIFKSYEQNRTFWHTQIEIDTSLKLVWAIDTRYLHILDIDDERHLQNKYIRNWIKNSPFFISVNKKLPKIFIIVDKMPPNKQNNFLDENLELHSGQWSYVEMDAKVYNSENVINNETYEDLCEYFPNLSTQPISDKNLSTTISDNTNNTSPISEKELDDLLSRLPLTVFKEYSFANCKYDFCWLTISYMLKSWHEEKGLKLLHKYSKLVPDKYNEDNVNTFYQKQNKDGDYYNYFINLALHHQIHIFRTQEEEQKTPLLLKHILDYYKHSFINVCKKCIPDCDNDSLLTMKEYVAKAILNPDFITIFNRYFKYDILKLFEYNIFDYETTKILFETQIFDVINRGTHRCIDGQLESFGDRLSWLKYRHIKKITKKKKSIDPETGDEIEQEIIEDKLVHLYFLKTWECDPKARRYSSIIFNPARVGHYDDKYNLFDGLQCHKTFFDNPDCNTAHNLPKLLEYIKERLCGGHEEFYEWFLNYLAHLIQYPHKMSMVNVILKGLQGNGKGLFIHFFGNCMIGTRYYLYSNNPKQIIGQFNGDLQDKLLINYDEASGKDTFQAEDKLKGYITEPVLQIERKGKDFIKCKNYINFITSTNNTCCYAIPPDDRRFTGVESKSSTLEIDDIREFTQFFSEDNIGLVCEFRQFLLDRNLDNIHLQRTRVITPFYTKCQTICAPTICTFIYDYITRTQTTEDFQIYASELYREYKLWNSESNTNRNMKSDKKFSDDMKQHLSCIPKVRLQRKKIHVDRQVYHINRNTVLNELKRIGLGVEDDAIQEDNSDMIPLMASFNQSGYYQNEIPIANSIADIL